MWLWIALIITVGSFVLYFYSDPVGGRNGGTVVGYFLGVLSTIGIIYLMWYGIRKRSYYARYTTLKGVLSSHIWIGIALIFIVPLHSGFSFGWNLHTATYVIMLLTIATGIWGVFLFRAYPQRLSSQRGGPSANQLATAIYSVKNEIRDIISASTRSDSFFKMIQSLDFESDNRPVSRNKSGSKGSDFKVSGDISTTSIWRLLFSKLPRELSEEESAKILADIPREEEQAALSCMQLIHKKRDLYNALIKEARANTIIRGWLFLHVPLSVGLCVLLLLHIFSVFFYW
ncbi:MAG TPA: hypothetical protein PKA63_02535 [Oligoflexia bacterium]|nr:hypothetical protein [Oligoflexia bacterium]